MVATALSGFLTDDGGVPDGTIVTAVFPGGCQMNCGFCIVRHRGERNSMMNGVPPPDHYNRVLRSYSDSGTLAGAAVIGDEPLQDAVWPYVKGFLEVCTEVRRPSTLITNGLGLADFAERLERFSLTEVVVSLDGVGRSHDRVRGLQGAFARIERGLLAVSRESRLFPRLSIATILRPEHLVDAEEVMRFVLRIGIKKWLVSPLLDPRAGRPIRVHAKLRPSLAGMLRSLGDLARKFGVSMVGTDEFALVDEIAEIARGVGFPIKRPRSTPSLIRLDARGRCWTWDQLSNGLAESTWPLQVHAIARQVTTLRTTA